ncbi:ArsR/SmtB family transcription factor [Geodermatophilus maliterrae]|uniref:ArsR/SmtB family transcription factor n=1 Tax=Geodermatophilus maliterrae TaxID=3162531 RepID=A0ABV3XAV0_9ACTN
MTFDAFIDDRRSSMNHVTVRDVLDRRTAETYAEWFRALADPTRVQLLAWLAQQPEPVSVGELAAVLPIGQSTVSHHLAALAAVGFVQVQRRGTRSLYAVNASCLECFPSAADVVMGRRPPDVLRVAACRLSSADPRS